MRRTINFGIKLFCLAVIFLFFSRYQVLANRIAEVEAENQAQVEAAEAHNKEVEAKMLADQGIEEKGFYKDGTYAGTGQGYGGVVETEVIVKDGFVTEIEVKRADNEDPVYLNQAKKLLKKMIDAQSNDVDTVSGATFSSIGLIESVGDALGKAV